MEVTKAQILTALETVDRERTRREDDARLMNRVLLIKRYQQRRFEQTYAHLLNSTRYAAASRFFLEELYGPRDFQARDQQFARIVPKLVSMFPAEVIETVGTLAALHAVSEQLDTLMAERLDVDVIDRAGYSAAWRQVGKRDEREFQLQATLAIGKSLDRFTRHPWIVKSLRWMRKPANLAGLGDLQSFLERGLSCFASLGGASEFLATIETRERALMDMLFQAGQPSSGSCESNSIWAWLPARLVNDPVSIDTPNL